MDRRTYLRTSGSAAIGLAFAGCITSQGGDGGDGEAGDGEGDTETTTQETTSANTEIVAGTAPGFPPFEMKQGGELTGFDIELLRAVVEQTDYTLTEWKEFEFKTLIPALTSDKIDVIAAAMTITQDRDKTIDFTNPYYSADQSILVRESGDFSPSKLSDLAGHQVGAQKGTTGEGQVQKLIENGTLKQSNYNSYGNYVFAVQDLENGNVDAVVLDKPVAKTFAQERAVEIATTIQTGERYGFGVRNEADDLTTALNEGLAAVKENGTYDELKKKWFASG